MRVLFLDDNESRYRAFKEVLIGSKFTTVDWATDAIQAIKMLSNNPKYDLVCFDHDLDEEHYRAWSHSGSEADYGDIQTGYDVAVFLVTELEEEKHPTYTLVHSFNSDGAKRIASVLNEAGSQKYMYILPFNPDGIKRIILHIEDESGN